MEIDRIGKGKDKGKSKGKENRKAKVKGPMEASTTKARASSRKERMARARTPKGRAKVYPKTPASSVAARAIGAEDAP